jgi:hypothetical protein
MLSVIVLDVELLYCNAECRYAECRYAECRYAECRYAECRYAECRYADCRGATPYVRHRHVSQITDEGKFFDKLVNVL